MKSTLLGCAVATVLLVAGGRGAGAESSQPRLLHLPTTAKTTEQGVLTPVPVSLQVPTDLDARRVLLHYHVFGAAEWRTLELHRSGVGYAGAIPCLEVSEMTREVRYYIRIHDAVGAVVAYSGTRASPYRVAIYHPSARPEFAAAAGRCPDPAECPPGLPGCPSPEVERIPCKRDRDCEGGLSCDWEGYCGDDPRRKNWLGVDVTQGLGLVPAQGACSVSSQESAGYACFRERDGAIYTGRPVYSNEPLGVGSAPTRLILSYERVLFYNTSVGARAGYAFAGSGPTLPAAAGFVPYSAELFARYWFGDDPFARGGLRVFAEVGAGAAQFDVDFKLRVREDPVASSSAQGGNDLEQTLRVWKRAGDAFVSIGMGTMYPFTESFAAVAQVSACQAFPYAGTFANASAGLRVGLR